MNTVWQFRITINWLAIKTFITLLLLVVVTGCTTHKAINNISREEASRLRDSAYKYAMGRTIIDKKADPYYDTLFRSKYLTKADYWFAGRVAADVGNYTKSIGIWTKMQKVKNDDEYDYAADLPLQINPSFGFYEGLIHTKGFKKLWSHYPNYPLVHNLSDQDSALAKKIKLLYGLDQRVRHRSIDSPSVQNSRLWTVRDSINAISVDSILMNRGVITTKEFGTFISFDFCIMFDHLPEALLIRRMPLIEAAYKSRGISKSNYTLIKDRSLVFAKKQQIYGTQFHLDTNTKKNIFFPITRIAKVDKRRKKMGLGKLKFYGKSHKVLLPEGYNPY